MYTRTDLWFININPACQITNTAPNIKQAHQAPAIVPTQQVSHRAYGAAVGVPTSTKAELAMVCHYPGTSIWNASPNNDATAAAAGVQHDDHARANTSEMQYGKMM